MSMWRNGRKYKCKVLFPFNNLAHKGLSLAQIRLCHKVLFVVLESVTESSHDVYLTEAAAELIPWNIFHMP